MNDRQQPTKESDSRGQATCSTLFSTTRPMLRMTLVYQFLHATGVSPTPLAISGQPHFAYSLFFKRRSISRISAAVNPVSPLALLDRYARPKGSINPESESVPRSPSADIIASLSRFLRYISALAIPVSLVSCVVTVTVA